MESIALTYIRCQYSATYVTSRIATQIWSTVSEGVPVITAALDATKHPDGVDAYGLLYSDLFPLAMWGCGGSCQSDI